VVETAPTLIWRIDQGDGVFYQVHVEVPYPSWWPNQDELNSGDPLWSYDDSNISPGDHSATVAASLRWGTYTWTAKDPTYGTATPPQHFTYGPGLAVSTPKNPGSTTVEATSVRYRDVVVAFVNAHGQQTTKTYALDSWADEPNIRSVDVDYPWHCRDSGRHVVSVAGTGEPQPLSQVASFATPTCSHRFSSSHSSPTGAGERSRLGEFDSWQRRVLYRVCVAGPGLHRCWRRHTNSNGRDSLATPPLNRLGRYRVHWAVVSDKDGRLGYQHRAIVRVRLYRDCDPSPELSGSLQAAYMSCATARRVAYDYFASTPPGRHVGPATVHGFSCDAHFGSVFHINCQRDRRRLRFAGFAAQ